MASPLYPESSPELARRRRELAPDVQAAFEAFGRQVFADGALDAKTKQLIAVAVAHVTQCPIASRGTRRRPSAPARPRRNSWRPFGSQPRCGPERPTRMPRSWSPHCPRINRQAVSIRTLRWRPPLRTVIWSIPMSAGSQQPNVRLKRAYETPAADDGARILVGRLWPRAASSKPLPLTHG